MSLEPFTPEQMAHLRSGYRNGAHGIPHSICNSHSRSARKCSCSIRSIRELHLRRKNKSECLPKVSNLNRNTLQANTHGWCVVIGSRRSIGNLVSCCILKGSDPILIQIEGLWGYVEFRCELNLVWESVAYLCKAWMPDSNGDMRLAADATGAREKLTCNDSIPGNRP